MSERVTRAQAEAALARMEDAERCHERRCNCLLDETDPDCDRAFRDICEAGDLVRAYLAQRPDEDTIRKGHEAMDGVSVEAVRRAGGLTAQDAEWQAAILAAMYEPEEGER